MFITHRYKILVLTGYSDPVVTPLSPEAREADTVVPIAEVPEPVVFIRVVLRVRRPARPARSSGLTPHPRRDIRPDLDVVSEG